MVIKFLSVLAPVQSMIGSLLSDVTAASHSITTTRNAKRRRYVLIVQRVMTPENAKTQVILNALIVPLEGLKI